MSQWIDRPGPDDEPVVRVEDDLTDAGEHRQGMDDVHGDVRRDRYLRGEETDVDDDVAEGLPGSQNDQSGQSAPSGDAGPQQRAGGAPAKKHGDPLR